MNFGNIILIGLIGILLVVGVYYLVLFFKERKDMKLAKEKAYNDLQNIMSSMLGGVSFEGQQEDPLYTDFNNLVYPDADQCDSSDCDIVSERISE